MELRGISGGDTFKDTSKEELTGSDAYSKEEAGVKRDAGMSSLGEKKKEVSGVQRVKLRKYLI